MNWIVLIIISLDYTSGMTRNFQEYNVYKSINKQTEYDNLVLEQDILSKKKW